MKKQALAMYVVVALVAFLGLSASAFAGNNPRIDQALMENLAEKQALKVEISKNDEPTDSQINSRYRAVEVLEMGDELGGFANSKGLAEDETHKAVEALE